MGKLLYRSVIDTKLSNLAAFKLSFDIYIYVFFLNLFDNKYPIKIIKLSS